MAAVLTATNPFLTQFGQEGRMYALLTLLGAGGGGSLRARVRVAEPWLGDRVRGGAGRHALHPQLVAVLRRRLRSRVAVPAVAEPRSARAARPRRDRLRRGTRAVPAVAADRALPGGPHGRAVVGAADPALAARDTGHDARPVRTGGAPAGRRRRSGDAAEPRRGAFAGRLAAGDRRAHGRARLAVVAALAGMGQPLSGGRGGAAAAGPRRRTRPRGPARDRGTDRGGRARRRRHGAGRQEQRARRGAHDRAQPASRRPRDLDPARADLCARLLPARRRALTRR